MAISLKELVKNEELLTGGHRACTGCTGSNILRQIMLVAGKNTVVGGATGCMGTRSRQSAGDISGIMAEPTTP